jgi:diacylglycerol kinase family enzyme
MEGEAMELAVESRQQSLDREDSGRTHDIPQVKSALLVINRTSGTGRTPGDVDCLRTAFYHLFASIPNCIFVVTNSHDEVVRQTRDFLTSAPGPHFLLAGGGGGTNRALVQGLMEQVEKGIIQLKDVQISSLRLGSGNVVPRYFGLSSEPLEAMRDIAAGVFAGWSHPCGVYRCTLYYPNSVARSEYGITLGGLGQFARVPADVKRWKDRNAHLIRQAARAIPIEAINTTQYVFFNLRRAAQRLLNPRRAEWVEVRYAGDCRRVRLWSGFLLNFDFPQLPIRSGCGIGEPRLMFCLLSNKGRIQMLWTLLNWRRLDGRVLKYEITPEMPIELVFLEDDATIVALDEDTFTAPARIGFEVAGTVRFVTSAAFAIE